MALFEVYDNQTNRCVSVDRERVTIGRGRDNEVIIDDSQASRTHCEIRRNGAGYVLQDLNSRNGTRLNQDALEEPVSLDDGDEIGIGGAAIRFWTSQKNMSDEARKLPLLDLDKHRPKKSTKPSPNSPEQPRSEKKHQDAKPDQIDLNGSKTFQPSDADQLLIPEALLTGGMTLNDILPLYTDGKPAHDKNEDASQISVAMLRLKQLLLRGFQLSATDIHIEPRENTVHLRYRIDGALHHSGQMDHRVSQSVLSIIKLLCNLDIQKKHILQDGAFSIQLPDRRVNMRISLAPVPYGDKMVIRILDKNVVPTGLENLGMEEVIYDQVYDLTRRDSSMMIVCGPTGSGKTTTLYAVLQEMNQGGKNIVTVEDPIEYRQDNITQIQINPRKNVTFSSALKSLLRQDPDVILIGEIRDLDTATMAVQSAMTGHLVLSTLHSRDSIGSIFRLLDLGVESFLLGSALSMILSQRLLRQLCPHCKAPVYPATQLLAKMGVKELAKRKLYSPVGCEQCLGIGYKGRIPIFEILTLTDQVREAISSKPTIQQLRTAAGDWIFQTLNDDAIRKMRNGLTSLEEYRAIAVNEGYKNT